MAQNLYVSTTAPGALRPSSRASSRRPSTGFNPITSKYPPSTTPAWISRVSPNPCAVKSVVEKVPIAPIVFKFLLMSVISGIENVALSTCVPGGTLLNVNQTIFFAIDQRGKQYTPDDAEEGRVCANAQR